MKFFDKKKYIETEYEDRHIENLNKAYDSEGNKE